jgi:hypothetical protein
MSKLRTFINSEGNVKQLVWDPQLFEEQHALVASILRDMEPKQREKELAEMRPYERAGVLRHLSS